MTSCTGPILRCPGTESAEHVRPGHGEEASKSCYIATLVAMIINPIDLFFDVCLDSHPMAKTKSILIEAQKQIYQCCFGIFGTHAQAQFISVYQRTKLFLTFVSGRIPLQSFECSIESQEEIHQMFFVAFRGSHPIPIHSNPKFRLSVYQILSISMMHKRNCFSHCFVGFTSNCTIQNFNIESQKIYNPKHFWELLEFTFNSKILYRMS